MHDANGNAVNGDTNGQGVTTFHPSEPTPKLTAAPNGQLQDQNGRTYTSPPDANGNSTVHTNNGKVLRCHTIASTGQTVCD